MIISKQSLRISELSRTGEKLPVLENIHFTSDGSAIAHNGSVLVAVSPVSSEIKESIPLEETPGKPLTVSNETVKEVIKNIPKDALFKGLLEYCNLDVIKKRFTIHDGKRKKTIESKLFNRPFINFKKIFKRASGKGYRIVLNRNRLKNLLDVIDKVAPDTSGYSPIYIDFTKENNVLLKSINYKTKQRIIAVMTSYKNTEGRWLDPDEWEKNLCQRKQVVKND